MRLTLAVVVLVVAGSGSDDRGAGNAGTPAGPATGADDRHLVVFDVNGTLTADEGSAVEWLQDPSDEPPPRDLAPTSSVRTVSAPLPDSAPGR